MSFETWLHSTLFGEKVGEDEYGNRYYQSRSAEEGEKRKRWVLYKGVAEPSKVPAQWHSWLHYTSDKVPAKDNVKRYSWQKPHIPNLTGTQNAYGPPGSVLKGGKRAPTTADYQPWQPK